MSLPDPGVLDAVRRRRGDLDDALLIVRDGLVADVPGPRRVAALRAGLRQLRADLYEHVAATEGPDGLYDEVRRADPRFGRAVRRLRSEHARLGLLLDELLAGLSRGSDESAGWSTLRPKVVDLIALMGRHRSRDAQLAYDSVSLDLGGQG
ncbi:hemerythrin domain-containing protein [Embleya sp. NBC_00896]|uniref:hemerythrin domain-containing protein n=1 Tax=Embleya sp. NBC_00896 TaxID=2975961 RepID=UPI0038702628|nr:hemerythrin domain-containing protein [Embleya sp. NBC_00896]